MKLAVYIPDRLNVLIRLCFNLNKTKYKVDGWITRIKDNRNNNINGKLLKIWQNRHHSIIMYNVSKLYEYYAIIILYIVALYL